MSTENYATNSQPDAPAASNAGAVSSAAAAPERYFFRASAEDFKKIPGSPIAYWVSSQLLSCFADNPSLSSLAQPKKGIDTGKNDLFMRLWSEVGLANANLSFNLSDLNTSLKWFRFNKGGSFRKWYGNNFFVVDWEDNGSRIRNFAGSTIRNESFLMQPCVTWSDVTSSQFSARYGGGGAIHDNSGPCAFGAADDLSYALALLCSKLSNLFLSVINPTLHFQIGNLAQLPICSKSVNDVTAITEEAVSLARADWDNFETSWDFADLPLLRNELKADTLAATWSNWDRYCRENIARMQALEEENNRLWIEAYGLQDELTPEVPEEEITLARADRRKDMVAFLSYAVGCMMGRYSLDKSGLILANAGDTVAQYLSKVGEPLEQLTYKPDADAILPVLEGEWFADDIVARTREFLRVTFGAATLAENIRFIEESLGKELRKYFVSDFYKDHLQTYKKRPIYWMVQSPKKSFQALIYLHRYNRDTFNLLLNDYLREFQNKLRNRLEHLKEVLASESTSPRDKTAATKEQSQIEKSLTELADWERDTILPLAQQRLEIDLDDGVKQNYPKFGKALAKIPGVS